MSLIENAARLFTEQSGQDLDVNQVSAALGELLPSSNGELDMGELIANLTSQEGGLANAVGSWLGDSDNQGVDASDLVNTLGESKIQGFADKLGIGFDDASNGLSNMIPNLIDGSSEGGSLLDGIGGGLVKNVMDRLF